MKVGALANNLAIQQKLIYCWANVEDGGPTLNQHWFYVSCVLGMHGGPAATNAIHKSDPPNRLRGTESISTK